MKPIKTLAFLLSAFFFIGCASTVSTSTASEDSVEAVANTNEAAAEEPIENAEKKPGTLIDRYISGEVSSD